MLLKDLVYLHLEASGSYIAPEKLRDMEKIAAHYKYNLLDGSSALEKLGGRA